MGVMICIMGVCITLLIVVPLVAWAIIDAVQPHNPLA